jgi:3-(3-hydroxy-phenyl)propionate hydroxylase
MPEDPLTKTIRFGTAVVSGAYELPVYPFVEPAELRGVPLRHPVAIIGGGLVGLTLACDLALRGVPAVLLDEDDTVGVRGASSRGICYAQKSLEIFQRLGIYERVRSKGVQWSVGRTLAGSDEIYRFDLRTQHTHDVSEQPPFINLQQFYVEWLLVDRIQEIGVVDLRWKNCVRDIKLHSDHALLQVETPGGEYTCQANWVIDCSGAHSTLREKLGVGITSNKAIDRWCISDVRFAVQPPAERRTWIEAPFNDNRAVWQHPMADLVWRLDYQMPPDADPDAISHPDVVADRIRRQFGPDVKYELVWVGPYAYRSQCLDTFRTGRALFAGDAAHVMSPFGARGGNSGIQDADNLAWKLALVLEGKAPEHLLDSYSIERRAAALQNIHITARTTRFLSPQQGYERTLRDAVIALAREFPFARAFVNTGRLSTPTQYRESPLNVGTRVTDGDERRGRHVQNVALTLPDGSSGDLIELLAQSDGALLVFLSCEVDRYLAPELERMQARYPVRFLSLLADASEVSPLPAVVDSHGKLAPQLALQPGLHPSERTGIKKGPEEKPEIGAAAFVRPDLYLAGVIEEPDALAIERAVRTILGDAKT